MVCRRVVEPLTTILFGLGCVVAIICAAHSPKDGRREAVALSSLLIVNWALFILAYTEWSPKMALDRIGIYTSSIQLWMIADSIIGAMATIAYRFWWGRALWAVCVVQILLHIGMEMKLFDPVVYTDDLLNAMLLVQLAIFFVIGGAGARDRASYLYRRTARLFMGRGQKAACIGKES